MRPRRPRWRRGAHTVYRRSSRPAWLLTSWALGGLTYFRIARIWIEERDLAGSLNCGRVTLRVRPSCRGRAETQLAAVQPGS